MFEIHSGSVGESNSGTRAEDGFAKGIASEWALKASQRVVQKGCEDRTRVARGPEVGTGLGSGGPGIESWRSLSAS